MTRHVQHPREQLYQASVCGDPPFLTGGTWSRENADCRRCIGLYDQMFPTPDRSETGEQ